MAPRLGARRLAALKLGAALSVAALAARGAGNRWLVIETCKNGSGTDDNPGPWRSGHLLPRRDSRRCAIGRETVRHGTMHRDAGPHRAAHLHTDLIYRPPVCETAISRYFYRFSTRPLKLNRSRTPGNYAESLFTPRPSSPMASPTVHRTILRPFATPKCEYPFRE